MYHRGPVRRCRHSTGYRPRLRPKQTMPKVNQKQVSKNTTECDTCLQRNIPHQNNTSSYIISACLQSLCFDKHIDTFHCGSAGYVYTNKTHDVTVIFPKGAVHETISVQVGIMLRGPFSFPDNSRPVSPILLLQIQPTVEFSKPIQVVLPHYLNCTTESDCKQLVFMKADHSNIDTKYHFKETDGKATFKPHINYGFLYTSHCCLQCITLKGSKAATPKTKFALITAYPKNPDRRVNVYFGVTYFLPTCMEVSIFVYPFICAWLTAN